MLIEPWQNIPQAPFPIRQAPTNVVLAAAAAAAGLVAVAAAAAVAVVAIVMIIVVVVVVVMRITRVTDPDHLLKLLKLHGKKNAKLAASTGLQNCKPGHAKKNEEYPFELESKLLAHPLNTPRIVSYMIPLITPSNEVKVGP